MRPSIASAFAALVLASSSASSAHSQALLPAPDTVIAQETAPGKITVTWAAVPGATEYLLFKAAWPNGARLIGVVTGTQWVDTTVSSGTKYTYMVNGRAGSSGNGRRKRSNDLIAGTSTNVASNVPVTETSKATITNPKITTPVTAASDTNPVIQAPPAGSEKLASPRTDTTSCLTAESDTSAAARERAREAARIARIQARAGGNPTDDPGTGATSNGVAAGSTTYREGRCRNGTATGYPELWDPVAAASGLSTADQIAAWKEIEIVALAYQHILNRQPTPTETKRDVAALKSGTSWKKFWQQLAQSPERDQKFGFWAPAPIATQAEAKQIFGLPFMSASQQCFGGLGPGCAGGIPEIANDKVQPVWFGAFRMPDNTSMGYVQIGVAVGSILHDNACLRDMTGLNCNGLGAGDLIKLGPYPGVREWNKASWNVIDHRTWRETFGPYPTDARERLAEWYDDIRLVGNRTAFMADVISMLAFPGLTIPYQGGETKRTLGLQAPSGASLDFTDVAFCRARAYSSRGDFPLKASWIICR